MESEAPRALHAQLTTDEEVRHLVRALNLSERFHFYVIVCSTVRASDALLQMIETQVAAERGKPLRLVRLDPYAGYTDAVAPIPREELASRVLAPLLADAAVQPQTATMWAVDATRAPTTDVAAWQWLFERMNQHRNEIVHALRGEFLLILPPRLELPFIMAAPDFWDIHSSVVFRIAAVALDEFAGWELEAADRGRRSLVPALPGEVERNEEELRAQLAKARESALLHGNETPYLSHFAGLATEAARIDAARARVYRDRHRRREALAEFDEAVKARREITEIVARSIQSIQLQLAMIGNDADKLLPSLGTRRSIIQPEEQLVRILLERADTLYEDGDTLGAIADVEEALRRLQGLLDAFGSQPEWQRMVAHGQIHMGDIQHARGSVKEAFAAYAQAKQIVIELLRKEPDSQELLRDRSVIQERTGDVWFALGGISAALAAYLEALSSSRKLQARDPKQPEWMHDVCIGLDRVGDAHMMNGDIDDAQNAYEEAAEVSAALEKTNPEWPEWIRLRSVHLVNLGDLQYARRNFVSAANAYGEALFRRRSLMNRDPERPEWIRDLAVVLCKLGDLCRARGDLVQAVALLEEALTLFRQLHDRDPERPEWLRDLCVALCKVGDVHRARREPGRALACYEEAFQGNERLLARDRRRPEWLRDRSAIERRIHAVHTLRADDAGTP